MRASRATDSSGRGDASSPRNSAVVVPAFGSPQSTTVLRSLGRRGVHTIVAAESASPPASWSRYCDERVRVPAPADDATGYRNALLDLARRDDVAAILPLREADAFTLAKHRDAFAPHVADVWPSMDVLATVHDRLALFEVAERAGVAVPETQLLTDVDDWDRERIAKGRYALLAADYDTDQPANRLATPAKTRFLEPGEEPTVDAFVDAMGHVPIVQSYVPGTEYCLRALYDDGDVVATSQKRLVRGYRYSRGPSVHHEAVDVPELEAAGLALLDELEFHGMASVGFVRDETDGRFRLLEVNPRLPASVPVDVHAGVDYPWYLWRLATEGVVDETVDYCPGRASHLLRGELVHLYSVLGVDEPIVDRPSVLGTVASMMASMLAAPRFDQFSVRDPGPFLKDALDATLSLVR